VLGDAGSMMTAPCNAAPSARPRFGAAGTSGAGLCPRTWLCRRHHLAPLCTNLPVAGSGLQIILVVMPPGTTLAEAEAVAKQVTLGLCPYCVASSRIGPPEQHTAPPAPTLASPPLLPVRLQRQHVPGRAPIRIQCCRCRSRWQRSRSTALSSWACRRRRPPVRAWLRRCCSGGRQYVCVCVGGEGVIMVTGTLASPCRRASASRRLATAPCQDQRPSPFPFPSFLPFPFPFPFPVSLPRTR
jgi:hypothetical protein